jgi:hypothetical protein
MSQKQIHNQRTSVLHKNITIVGSLAQPFDLYKISKLPIYKQNCCNHQECDRIVAFKVFSRRLLCQTVQTIFCCQTSSSSLDLLCQTAHAALCQTRAQICQSFLAFHLCVETRSQPPLSFSVTAFIGIRMRPDTHECS